jgi:hypothetical protein
MRFYTPKTLAVCVFATFGLWFVGNSVARPLTATESASVIGGQSGNIPQCTWGTRDESCPPVPNNGLTCDENGGAKEDGKGTGEGKGPCKPEIKYRRHYEEVDYYPYWFEWYEEYTVLKCPVDYGYENERSGTYHVAVDAQTDGKPATFTGNTTTTDGDSINCWLKKRCYTLCDGPYTTDALYYCHDNAAVAAKCPKDDDCRKQPTKAKKEADMITKKSCKDFTPGVGGGGGGGGGGPVSEKGRHFDNGESQQRNRKASVPIASVGHGSWMGTRGTTIVGLIQIRCGRIRYC